MTYAAELASIEQRFLSNWETTPVALDEGVCIDPDQNIVDQPDNSEFVRISVRGAREEQASLGGAATTHFRNYGLITVAIYVPVREGHAKGRQHADTISAIFRGQQFDGITCRAASVTELGKIEGGWFQTNVDIPYFRDDHH